jgi:hypothetical protein
MDRAFARGRERRLRLIKPQAKAKAWAAHTDKIAPSLTPLIRQLRRRDAVGAKPSATVGRN